jgi:hypothetical protein
MTLSRWSLSDLHCLVVYATLQVVSLYLVSPASTLFSGFPQFNHLRPKSIPETFGRGKEVTHAIVNSLVT